MPGQDDGDDDGGDEGDGESDEEDGGDDEGRRGRSLVLTALQCRVLPPCSQTLSSDMPFLFQRLQEVHSLCCLLGRVQ